MTTMELRRSLFTEVNAVLDSEGIAPHRYPSLKRRKEKRSY